MASITLSPEQIRAAPPEVRRWIEQELATSLGLEAHAGDARGQPAQLASCSREELSAVLGLIQGAFPVVNVFFELGRKGASFGQDRLEAYRLSDIQHHTRLQSTDQVIACLNMIGEALRRVRGTAEVSFYGLDGDYCFIATQTRQNIRQLWFELIGRGETSPVAGSSVPDEGVPVREPTLPVEPAAAALHPGVSLPQA